MRPTFLVASPTRVQREESPRAARLTLDELEELAGIVTFAIDTRTGAYRASPRMREFFPGIDLEGRGIEAFLDRFEPAGRAKILADWNDVRGGRLEGPYEWRIRAPDGSLRHLRSAWEAVRGPDGEVLGLRGYFQDVSDRVEAEQEARFHARLLDAVGEAVIATDAEGRITYWNRRAEELYGWSRREVLGRDIMEVTPSEDMRHAAEEIMEHLRTGRRWSGEFIVRRRDGARFPALVTDVPLLDDEGRLEGIIGVSVDLRERKRAEEAERLAERQRAELTRLEEVDRLKTQFINTAAHELNTPLTPLRLQVHRLGSERIGPLNDAQRRSLQLVERNLARLNLLVQDILDASRVQADRLGIEPRAFDLSELFHEAHENFVDLAEAAEVRLSCHCEPGVRVVGDPRRIMQVAANLVSNAIKVSPGGGRVEVTARPLDGRAVVQVRDEGVGLTEDQKARLFTAFAQLHDDPRLRGTGLGLFISRAIVEAHGGTLRVQSDGPGKGAVFTFDVPLATPTVEAAGSVRP